MHAHAAVASHHVAGVRRIDGCLAGEEPLDGHAEAASDVEQRGDRRVGEVAFQLADVAGGELALFGQLAQRHAAAFAQATDARAEEVRFRAGGGGLVDGFLRGFAAHAAGVLAARGKRAF
ncbi:hypothetical protein D3C76_1560530 [compost metagenome]